jgi:hypothetical protein
MYIHTNTFFIYACVSVCAIIAIFIFWDWSIHSWNKNGWLSKDSNGPWWKHGNRGKIAEWSTVFSTFPFPLQFKHWSGWTVLAACLPVRTIHVAKCQCWSNISPTKNVVRPTQRCKWNMTAMLRNEVSHPVMLKHNVHLIDVTKQHHCVLFCLQRIRHDRLIHYLDVWIIQKKRINLP